MIISKIRGEQKQMWSLNRSTLLVSWNTSQQVQLKVVPVLKPWKAELRKLAVVETSLPASACWNYSNSDESMLELLQQRWEKSLKPQQTTGEVSMEKQTCRRPHSFFWKSQKGGTSLTQLCPLPKLAPTASTLQPTQLISYSGRSQPDTAQLW